MNIFTHSFCPLIVCLSLSVYGSTRNENLSLTHPYVCMLSYFRTADWLSFYALYKGLMIKSETHSGQLTELSLAWLSQWCILMNHLHVFLSLASLCIQAILNHSSTKWCKRELTLIMAHCLTFSVRTQKAASQTARQYRIEISFVSYHA